jgi:hypothetical protein
MTVQSRVSQDRRNTSRVMARLDCSLTVDGAEHKAVIVDLSMKGAFLSSKILPRNGSTVTVAIQPPAVKKELVFTGTVIRGTRVTSDHGELGRFGIRFGSNSTDLLMLISKLYS